jgi:DNA-binding response OmpR family regulator
MTTPSTSPRLLVVEDDDEMRAALSLYLEDEGYAVTLAEDGTAGCEAALAVPGYDLVILDAKLPERDGFAVLNEMRTKGVQTPVLMLTGLTKHEHKMQGFRLGADDYLTKPFATEELGARVEALLRRSTDAEADEARFTVGGLDVDLAAGTVRRDGQEVDLTDLEFKLLRYLLRHRGRTVTREQVLRDVWGLPANVETRTIDRHINALRDAMDGSTEEEWPIQSVYGVGYKMTSVEHQPEADRSAPSQAEAA